MVNQKNKMLSAIIAQYKPITKVVIQFPNGMYYKGKVKNVSKDFHIETDVKVSEVKETYSALPFRKHLVKEINIYVSN